MKGRLTAGIFCVLFAQSALTVPADARPRHSHRHHVVKHHKHVHKHHRHHVRYKVRKSQPVTAAEPFGFPSIFNTSTGLVETARRYIGSGAIFGRSNLWCARFMNYVLAKAGYKGTGSDMARSFAHYGRRVSGPRVGAIAVMSRGRRGGHVGVVSGIDAHGNPIIISGNHNRRVAESVYPRSRIYAYVVPK